MPLSCESRIGSILPEHIFDLWVNESVPVYETVTVMRPEYTVNDLYQVLQLGENEVAGILGYNWITRQMGSTSSVKADCGFVFTWHYHTDADSLVLSLPDWITFALSGAYATCLLSGKSLLFYVEEEKGAISRLRKICSDIYDVANNPNLQLFRFAKKLEGIYHIPSLENYSEAKIAEALGLKTYYFEY